MLLYNSMKKNKLNQEMPYDEVNIFCVPMNEIDMYQKFIVL